MTKLEERLNHAADEDAKLLRSQDSPLEMNRRTFKAGAKFILQLPELKALENCLSKFCEFKPNGEIKRMVSSTNEAIFDINSVDRARITMDQWRNFIGEESETL